MIVLVDIDGTLANCDHRLHLIKGDAPHWDEFFDACSDDTPIVPIVELIENILDNAANTVIFVTGRPERIRLRTLGWLSKVFENHKLDRPLLMMRKDGDHRKDDIVKAEMLIALRQLGYNPDLAIEDRVRVAELYRQEGIVTLQCAAGDY
jgi:hypothetical protein